MRFPSHPTINHYTGFLLRKVSAASFSRFAGITEARGLHPMHFGMLAIIESDGPVSQQELSQRTGIDPSTMVARVDVLEEHGLVERRRSAGDRRSYELGLTAKGKKVYAELAREAGEFSDRFFAALTKTERTELNRLLGKLADALDEDDGGTTRNGA